MNVQETKLTLQARSACPHAAEVQMTAETPVLVAERAACQRVGLSTENGSHRQHHCVSSQCLAAAECMAGSSPGALQQSCGACSWPALQDTLLQCTEWPIGPGPSHEAIMVHKQFSALVVSGVRGWVAEETGWMRSPVCSIAVL